METMYGVSWNGQIAKLHAIADSIARGAYSPEIAAGRAKHTIAILERMHTERVAAGDFSLYSEVRYR